MFSSTAEFPAARVARSHIGMPGFRVFAPVLVVAATLFALRAVNPSPDNAITDFELRNSHGGLYRGEVAAAAVNVGESHEWLIRLERRDHRPLAKADVKARLWMPESGREAAVQPTVTYTGAGNYRLRDVRLNRGGWWNVALVVNGRDGVDSLAFNVRVP